MEAARATITVRGYHKIKRLPERANVSIEIAFESPSKSPAAKECVKVTDAIKKSIQEAEAKDLLGVWNIASMRTWANRPWNQDGKQLPLVYHASCSIEVEFKDFTALSEWIEAQSEVEGVSIGGVDWYLTDDTLEQLRGEARMKAVGQAWDKARQYAEGAGLHVDRVVEVSDPGMLRTIQEKVENVDAEGGTRRRLADLDGVALSSSTDEGLDLTPPECEVYAFADVIFEAWRK